MEIACWEPMFRPQESFKQMILRNVKGGMTHDSSKSLVVTSRTSNANWIGEKEREREDHGLAADQARWGRDQNKVLALLLPPLLLPTLLDYNTFFLFS